MKKLTAIEWLIDQVEDYLGDIPTDIIEQAKEMEKAQKATTWNNAIDAELKNKWESFEQFHNETYKNK